ncbi:MAG: hypothetical protein J0M12_02860 [Deltaproteobacteria bacterium]|nr:hypothetical protein [Deltaproteobacteria bacterium]
MNLQRLITSCVTVLAILVWSNHCILGDAFASQETPSHQTSHCHGDESTDNGQDGGNHHSECKDSGCCQPAVQALHSIDHPQVVLDASPINFVAHSRVVFPGAHTELVAHPPTGPPRVLFDPVFLSSIAPNAPPFA